jgi:tetratricopeptide (TPR) repeat protein
MPQTEFARMRRTDHSLRPPTPATTLAHKSPNACNLCHKDREAAWADREVRRWHKDDYQARVVRLAGLVSAARNRDWARLPEMLSYLGEAQHDEIFTTSLIRLLNQSTDGRKWPALIGALKDSSPLVRSAAAHGLTAYLIPEARTALLGATQDGYRLVRVRAAGALAALPRDQLTLSERQALDKATAELEASLKARPDDWTSQYNLGNHYFDQNQLPEALAAFLTAHRLRPDVAMPLAHAALAQVRLGRPEEAETLLNRAFQMEPENALVNFNLGLFRAEQGVLAEAERHFRLALKADPGLARAAYNLAVILAGDRLEEAIEVCRQAHQAQPGEPKFTYTLAFDLEKKGRRKEAVNSLRQLLTQHPLYLDAYTFLGAIHEKSGEKNQALEVYRRALAQQDWLPVQRQYFEMRLRALTARDGGR